MEPSKKNSVLTTIGEVLGILGAISALGYATWDHLHPKPVPARTDSRTITNASRNHSSTAAVEGNTFNGGQNIVGNGSVTINSGQVLPQSSKEAARQRMHASGIEDSEDRYYSALQNHETDVLLMFNEAGRTLNQSDFRFFVNSLYDSEVAKVLMQVDQSSGCPTDPGAGFFYTQLKEPGLDFVKQVCSKNAVIDRLKQQIQKEEQRVGEARSNDVENETHRNREIASCEQTMIQTFGSRVSRATAHEQCAMRVPPTLPQSTAAENSASALQKALIMLSGRD